MPNQSSTHLTRRRFLIWLGNIALLVMGVGIGRGILRFLTPPLTQSTPKSVRAGSPNEFAQNRLTFIPPATAWLGHDEAGFFALSAICPHLGCTLRQTGQTFECLCHGSRFSRSGAVLNGPAAAPMTFLALRLAEGQLIIDLRQTVSPETRQEASQ